MNLSQNEMLETYPSSRFWNLCRHARLKNGDEDLASLRTSRVTDSACVESLKGSKSLYTKVPSMTYPKKTVGGGALLEFVVPTKSEVSRGVRTGHYC